MTYTFTDPNDYQLRLDSHGLLLEKPAAERDTLAQRIGDADLDVLAVQEVEDLDTLRRFNRDHLDGHFSHLSLLEGNDPRFIDVAVLSRLPLGATTSWQHAIHPDAPDRPVFGRDLLEVDILSPSRSRRLLRLYVTHAKSHFIDWRLRGDARDQAIQAANTRRPPKPDRSGPGPSSPAWTYRHKEPGQSAAYLLYDQIWLSPPLADRQTGATIDRRTKHGGDGSDHDLAWIDLDLP